MCEHCNHDHPEVPEAALAEFREIFESIEGLDEERRSLLIDTATLGVKKLLAAAVDEPDLTRSKALAMFASNTMNLIGLANASTADDHEDWTSTGDKRVSALWDRWVGTVRATTAVAPVLAEDLPEGAAERIASGHPTEADMEAVRQQLREHGIEVPEGTEIAFAGVVNTDGQPIKPEHSAGEDETPMPGLYL